MIFQYCFTTTLQQKQLGPKLANINTANDYL